MAAEPLQHTHLHRDILAFVTSTVDAVEGADHAAVSLVGDDRGLVTTSDVAEMLDEFQRTADQGPTSDAGRTGVITRINYLSDGVWPQFERVCSECKVRSVAAFPLTLATRTLGVLTLYSSDHHAFGAPELRIGRAAASELARMIARD